MKEAKDLQPCLLGLLHGAGCRQRAPVPCFKRTTPHLPWSRSKLIFTTAASTHRHIHTSTHRYRLLLHCLRMVTVSFRVRSSARSSHPDARLRPHLTDPDARCRWRAAVTDTHPDPDPPLSRAPEPACSASGAAPSATPPSPSEQARPTTLESPTTAHQETTWVLSHSHSHLILQRLRLLAELLVLRLVLPGLRLHTADLLRLVAAVALPALQLGQLRHADHTHAHGCWLLATAVRAETHTRLLSLVAAIALPALQLRQLGGRNTCTHTHAHIETGRRCMRWCDTSQHMQTALTTVPSGMQTAARQASMHSQAGEHACDAGAASEHVHGAASGLAYTPTTVSKLGPLPHTGPLPVGRAV